MKIKSIIALVSLFGCFSVFAESANKTESTSKTENTKATSKESSSTGGTQNPYEGLPGLFDTATPLRHTVVLDLPLTGINFGITERWSLGTNIVSVLALPFGLSGGYLTSRYRFYDDGSLSSAATAYLGFFKKGPLSVYGAFMTSNTQYIFNSDDLVNLNVSVGRVMGKGNGTADSDNTAGTANATGLMVSFKNAYFFTPGFSLVTMVGFTGGEAEVSDNVNDGAADTAKAIGQGAFWSLELEFIKQKSSRLSFGVVDVYYKHNGVQKNIPLPLIDYITSF